MSPFMVRADEAAEARAHEVRCENCRHFLPKSDYCAQLREYVHPDGACSLGAFVARPSNGTHESSECRAARAALRSHEVKP